MCRLLGIYGKVNFWQKIVFEFEKSSEFGNIPPPADEPGHKDGWGVAKSNNRKTATSKVGVRSLNLTIWI
jgi:predicted glutamine amidotransferase